MRDPTCRRDAYGRPSPLKILHLIAPAPAGGAESAVCSLAAGLEQLGHDVEVAALLPAVGAHPFSDRVAEAGLPLHEIRTGHRAYLAQVRALVDLIRRRKVDLLHTHVAHADVIGYLATRRTGVSWVTTVHGFTGEGLKNSVYLWLDFRAARRADAVICVARNVREEVIRRRVPEGRVHLIPNGYLPVPTLDRRDARRALELGPDVPTVGWIGRLSFEKGADLLIDALASLEGEPPTVVVIGDGPEREQLAGRAADLGLGPDRLRLAGRVDNAARLLPAFDVLALSSRTEGTPMVLLEAMAAGVPIVAFAVGGVPGVVSSESAFLARPEDVADFAANLRSALTSKDDAARRASSAYEVFLERFSVERCSEPVARLYGDIVSARES